MSLKLNQDAKAIGARFRSARSLVPDLNRKLFCERYGINRYTMQSWENGLHVSKGKNVEKFIEALAREGVFCTAEWLIDGKGEPARPMQGAQSSINANQEEEETSDANDDELNNVINALKKAHADIDEELISFIMPDDSMAPKFLKGDQVLGKMVKPKDVNLHQKYCIVELNPGRMIARKILLTKEGLILLALDERLPTFVLSIDSKIYKIIWHLVDQ